MILTAPRLLPQQRFDLEDFNLLLTGAQTDEKLFIKQFFSPTGMILKGFNVSGLSGPSPALITIDGATLVNADNTDCFSWFVGDTGAAPLPAVLLPSSRNYVEVELSTENGTPLTRAFWDPSAQGGLGAEFNQTVETVTNIKISAVVLPGGFSGNPNRLPIAIIDTDADNNIKVILDKRNLFFRLGTPSNPQADYAWGSQMEPELTLALTGVSGTFVAGEQVTIGGSVTAEVQTGGTTTIGVILPSGDALAEGQTVTGVSSGATGTLSTATSQFTGADKSLDNLREVLTALMTEIKATKGTRFWFTAGSGSIGGINSFLNSVVAPATATARVKWDGSSIYFLDDAVGPAHSDVMAKLRILNRDAQLNLVRQDDGKEIQTIAFSKVPTGGTLTLEHDGDVSDSINWNDSAADIQTACNNQWDDQVTVTGNWSDGFRFIFDVAGPVPAIAEDSNTLVEGSDPVTSTVTTIKNGLSGIAPIPIADGQVLYVEVPSSGDRTYSDAGSGATNFKVVDYGDFVNNDTNYWLAYREGSRLMFRGIGEVGLDGASDFIGGVPKSLLEIIGVASPSTPPGYSSDIRGTASESIVRRLGALTDAMGDSQEDRSAYIRSDDVVTWTGTELQFAEDLILEILNTKTGTLTQHVVEASASPISLADGDSLYVEIDRDIAIETVVPINSGTTPIPAQSQDKKDVIVLFRRIDALGAGYLHIPLHKQVFEPGQAARLGASGSGGGEFAPISDLNSLSFQAAFQDNFSEGPSSLLSGVDVSVGKTDPTTYNAARKLYSLAYDATLNTDSGTTNTNIVLDTPPSFTVKAGDVVVWGTEARTITAVISQQNFTVDAFSSSPGVSDPVTISQALHTKDVYGTDFDGNSIADAFGATTFDTILMNYEDSIGAGNDIYDIAQPAHLGFSCSEDGTSWTDTETRPSSEMGTILKTALLSAGTSLYMRFFSVATSGSGVANLLRYKVFMQEE